MPIRSVIALLLLINYLLVVGAGCVNRPEDSHELVLVQTRTIEEGKHYQQCRYLRMDGLEAFLTEALAARYQNDAHTTQHHLISVINGVDAHYLPVITWRIATAERPLPTLLTTYQLVTATGVARNLYTPPWLG